MFRNGIIFTGMFKKITATVLLLAFVAQSFSAPFIRLDYYFNKADYARTCVNKSRPMMHCNGQCQVMKKIREEEKKEQQAEDRKIGSKIEVLSSKSFYSAVSPAVFFNILPHTYSIAAAGNEVRRPRAFFHPPSTT